MSIFLTNVFFPLLPTNVDVLSELDQLVLKNYFFLRNTNGQEEQVILAITHNYIIVSQKLNNQQLNFFCPINFDLKFQVLRKQWTDQKTPGIPYGLRFDKGTTNDACQFYLNNPTLICPWIALLSKKINQRNFHKLFKAKKKIGKGAFATVYLAERLADKKLVAVKAFSKEKQFSGDKGKESLQNQIKIMRTIDHPNITTLQQVYETDNSIYVILQYLQGKQLNEQLKNGRKFKSDECAQIIKQILLGLQHLASKRIIHRDLKPQNIMFKKQGSLQLGICDFGLATHADQNKYLFVRCGTPGFVAPQIINIKDMTTKSQPISDVFSAGVIFHLLLLGHSIFPGKKYNDVLAQNRGCDFNFQKEQYQCLPLQALQLLKTMLSKDPKHRITSCQALRQLYFSTHCKVDNHSMDIQQQKQNRNKPLKQLFLNQINPIKNNSSYCQNMIDENQKKSNLISTTKKKMSFMGALGNNGYRLNEK